MKQPRLIAAEALLKVEKRGAWSNLTLDSQLRKAQLDARDSAFASALFYGVLERLLTLDACIGAHSKIKVEKLSAEVRATLRTALYQLLYMESIPDHAAVAESVELVRKLRKAQASGFVNGVLRSFLRAGKEVPLPSSSPEARLSVQYSCPTPLVKLWINSYGEDAARQLLAASLGRPPLYIRVNTLKITQEALLAELLAQGVEAQADGLLPNCLLLADSGAVQGLPQYKQGLFHVQDKSSQLCAMALGARPGHRVLDACSAPGGKAFTVAQYMQNTGSLLAADLHSHRVELVKNRGQEMGLTCIGAVVADMAEYNPALGTFDRVLCDVPCSGLGVIRRRPEIKYKPLEEFEKLPEIQYKILKTTAQYCKVGGHVLYSTCTLNPKENWEVVERFLKEQPQFSLIPLPSPLEMPKAQGLSILGEWNCDGFYMALLERQRE